MRKCGGARFPPGAQLPDHVHADIEHGTAGFRPLVPPVPGEPQRDQSPACVAPQADAYLGGVIRLHPEAGDALMPPQYGVVDAHAASKPAANPRSTRKPTRTSRILHLRAGHDKRYDITSKLARTPCFSIATCVASVRRHRSQGTSAAKRGRKATALAQESNKARGLRTHWQFK